MEEKFISRPLIDYQSPMIDIERLKMLKLIASQPPDGYCIDVLNGKYFKAFGYIWEYKLLFRVKRICKIKA